MLVEESHLLLDCPEDARVTGMEPYYELSLVIELFHKLALLLQIHIGRGNNGGSRFGAKRKFLWHKTSGIENQVRLLEHLSAPYAYKVRISRSCPHNLYMTLRIYRKRRNNL